MLCFCSGPRILLLLQVFEALWGTNELLSSMDSINILKPGQHESSTDGWLHVDQAPLRKGVACIQGLINMVDVSPETGETCSCHCYSADVIWQTRLCLLLYGTQHITVGVQDNGMSE